MLAHARKKTCARAAQWETETHLGYADDVSVFFEETFDLEGSVFPGDFYKENIHVHGIRQHVEGLFDGEKGHLSAFERSHVSSPFSNSSPDMRSSVPNW